MNSTEADLESSICEQPVSRSGRDAVESGNPHPVAITDFRVDYAEAGTDAFPATQTAGKLQIGYDQPLLQPL